MIDKTPTDNLTAASTEKFFSVLKLKIIGR